MAETKKKTGAEIVKERAVMANVDRLMSQGYTRGQAQEIVARRMALSGRMALSESRTFVTSIADGDLSAEKPLPLGPVKPSAVLREGIRRRGMPLDPVNGSPSPEYEAALDRVAGTERTSQRATMRESVFKPSPISPIEGMKAVPAARSRLRTGGMLRETTRPSFGDRY